MGVVNIFREEWFIIVDILRTLQTGSPPGASVPGSRCQRERRDGL